MRNYLGPNLISGALASLVFLLVFLLLNWPLLLSLVIAIGTFVGVYFLSQPVLKIGNVELDKLANGIELNNLYLDANAQIMELKNVGESISNEDIQAKTLELVSVGRDILNYLENNPREISQSRHFLTYFLPTANKIVENYAQLKRANVSENKFVSINEHTNESLDLLNKIFVNQRDGYHKDRLTELEVQNELLEKTMRLGGGE